MSSRFDNALNSFFSKIYLINLSDWYKKIIKFRLSIFDTYICQEYSGPFLLAVFGFVIIGIIDILFTLVDLFINSGVSFFVVFRLLIYKIPAIMVLFFPMALLFAIMLLLVRMAKDNEITVLRSSGVSFARILAPVIVLTIFTMFFSFMIEEEVVPWANRISDSLIRKEIYKTPPPQIAVNIFFKDEGNRYFYIKEIDSKTKQMKNVMVFQLTADFPSIITARIANWDKKTWVLKQGTMQALDSNGQIEYSNQFSEMKIHVDQEIASFYTEQRTAREMDSQELKNKIKELEKSGLSSNALKVDYHMKFSMPMACLIFGLMGLALCLTFVRSGKDWWGVIIAICIAGLLVGFYFFLIAICRSLGRGDFLSPFFGAWLPNIIYGMISLGIIIFHLITK